MVRSKISFLQCSSLYKDLKKAFEQSKEQGILIPQLYCYMLFIMLLKATERFIERGPLASCFAGKKVILYGAGGFGQEIYRAVTKQEPERICLWVDKRYQVYQKFGLQVCDPEQIGACSYDVIFIAVLDTKVCEKIAEYLVKNGAGSEKISYISPTEEYIEMLINIMEDEKNKG